MHNPDFPELKIEVDLEFLGFTGKEYIGEWKGYKVYRPLHPEEYDENGEQIIHYTGLPMYILEKHGFERWTDGDECFEIMHALYPEEYEDDEDDEDFDDLDEDDEDDSR